jgi:thiamine biosynthesis protein ThiS
MQVRIELNGKHVEIAGVETVGDLLRSKGLKPRLVAVEQNGEIVPRGRFDEREIHDGDRLEIVHFVGGGD